MDQFIRPTRAGYFVIRHRLLTGLRVLTIGCTSEAGFEQRPKLCSSVVEEFVGCTRPGATRSAL